MNNINYRGIDFEIPTLSDKGSIMFPTNASANKAADSVILQEIDSIWDFDKFQIESRVPIRISEVEDKTLFSKQNDLRVLDMPIKFPGSDEYRVPQELEQFNEVIQKSIDSFHALNTSAIKYFAYVTIDQGFVNAGKLQRNSGCHVDGFQGSRISPKVEINYSYLCYDKTPTLFYPQRFNVSGLDPAKDNFFLAFDRQVNEEGARFIEPYNVLLMNAYCVHKSGLTEEKGYRTFCRLTFEVREFDRLGNTHNPMFDYEWDMQARDIHADLS